MTNEQWHFLVRLLAMIPEEVVKKSPEFFR